MGTRGGKLILRWTTVLLVALAGCLAGASAGQAAPAGAEAWEQLQSHLQRWPNRHVSQAANVELEKWVADHFAQVAARSNDPAQQQAADMTVAAAEQARKVLDAVRLAGLMPPGMAESGLPSLDEAVSAWRKAEIDAARALQGLWIAGTMATPAPVFMPGRAVIRLGGARTGEIRAYVTQPNFVDPANLPPEGFAGRMVYVGQGSAEALAALDIRGAAVLLDFDTGNRWIDLYQLGAKLVLLLEPEQGGGYWQSMTKISYSPLTLPRLYVQRKDLTSALGANWQDLLRTGLEVQIGQQPSRWQRRDLQASWLFIPGTGAAQQQNRQLPELVHIQTYLDSNSIAPELSPGATAAANLVVLLQLVEQWRKTPPARPVLVSVINGHSLALAGEEEYAHTAFAPADTAYEELEWLERQLAGRRFVEHLYSRAVDEAVVMEMRQDTAMVAGLSMKRPVIDLLRARRNELREQYRQAALLIREGRRDSRGNLEPLPQAERERLIQQREDLDQRIEAYNDYMALFNRFGRVTDFKSLTDSQRAQVNAYFKEIATGARQTRLELEQWRDRLWTNLSVRRRLLESLRPGALEAANAAGSGFQAAFRAAHPPLPAIAGFMLDLTFDGDQLGLFPVGAIFQTTGHPTTEPLDRIATLAPYCLKIAADIAATDGRNSLLADTVRNVGGVPWNAHLGGMFAMASSPFHAYDQPGMTLTTTRDSRSRAFSPQDVVAAINRERFEALTSFATRLIPRLIDGQGLGATKRTVTRNQALTAIADVRVQDEYSVGLPQTVLPGALVAVTPSTDVMAGVRMFGDVSRIPLLLTGSTGYAALRAGLWRKGSLMAFGYDPERGTMTQAMDFALVKRYPVMLRDIKSQERFRVKLVVMFNSRKTDLLGLTAATNLAPLSSLTVLDARQDSAPRSYAVGGVAMGAITPPIPAQDGTASLMMRPGDRFKLLMGQSLAVGVTPSTPHGGGFAIEQGLLSDLVWQGAQDMVRLSSDRIAMLASKGVTDETARWYANAATEEVHLAEKHRDEGRPAAALTRAEEARGLGFWAYRQSRQTINDLIQAAVIFLALVIPFCFFLTKLISPFTDIGRQLMLFSGIFIVMAIGLSLVHPAFRVAETPVMVVLGFVILGLAVFVSSILMGRFNASMTAAVEQMQQSESVDAAQSRLAGVAFMVGVNNMKRRRIRTTLTCATIVLVTFTMLSVISVGQNVDPARVRVASQAPYTGILYTRPGLADLTDIQAQRLRAHFTDRATVVGRVWCQRLGQFGEYLEYELTPASTAPGQAEAVLHAKVLLGLDVAENGFLGPMPLLPGGRWFSSNAAAEMILSVRGAELLGIVPGNLADQRVRIAGRELQVVGLVDDEAMTRLKDMSEIPLLPVLRQASQSAKDQSNAQKGAERTLALETSGSVSLDAGGDLMSESGIQVARAIDVAMVPVDLARQLGDAAYRSIAVKYPDDSSAGQTAWRDANHFIRYQFARIYVGLTQPVKMEDNREMGAGQYSLASSTSTQVGGALKVAIPVILAATIIFNTMLGSVMERRREVGIYNAIGLNPGHVMMFFLAESVVFGMVGSVAGYLIGQVLSLVITHFQLLELNLNYSSMSVMVVIFLTIATVLLSTIYPAMMAARAAVPSGQRRWSLPKPEGDEIHIDFPFSYDQQRVLGVCAYLHDYMNQHTEASTGKFLARLGPVGTVPAAGGDGAGPDSAYVMVFDVAPAPFDLGVNQHMEVYAYYNRRVRAHMLSVYLTRASGDLSSWMTVNQPFLESLRKRLLGWRSQKQQTHELFYRRGEALFADAARLPVREASDAAAAAGGNR